MNEKKFAISALLKDGWELTKVNIGFLVVYQIVLWIVAFLFGGNDNPSWQMAVLQIVGFVILTLGNMGFYQSTLLMTLGIKPRFDQFYKNWPQLVSWFIAHILFSIMFVIGLILLIIPGFYVLARFGLFPFFILDQKLGPVESLKRASQSTEGVRMDVFLLFLAYLGINILGAIFFLIGLLITFPVTTLALAVVYRRLTGQTKASIQPEDIEAL